MTIAMDPIFVEGRGLNLLHRVYCMSVKLEVDSSLFTIQFQFLCWEFWAMQKWLPYLPNCVILKYTVWDQEASIG